MRLGLSTVCGVLDGARRDPDQTVNRLLAAEASFVELDGGIEPGLLDELLRRLAGRREELPVLSVEAPCPFGKAAAAELGSLDRGEAKVALDAALATLRLAGEAGARFVVIRLGDVTRLAAEWARARTAWQRGDFGEARRRKLLEARALAGRPHLDVVRRVLEQLCRRADDLGLVLAVRTPSRLIGLPSAPELGVLLGDLRGAPLAPMWDLPATHLLAEFGVPWRETAFAWKSAPLLRVGDACGPLAGLPPGAGEAPLAAMLAEAAPEAAAVYAPWPALTRGETEAAMRDLRRLLPPS